MEKAEPFDNYGQEMTAADFDGNGIDDLAIAAPQESEVIGGTFYWFVGHVSVLYGTPSGLEVTAYSDWHQGKSGVATKRDPYDQFGYSMTAGDFNNDGRADLVVAAPGEDVALDNGSKQINAGMLHIFYGTQYGLLDFLLYGRETFTEPKRTNGTTAGSAEIMDGFGGTAFNNL